MVFSVKDSAGALTNMFFRSIALSMSNVEKVEITTTEATAPLIQVTYHNPENLEKTEMTEVTTAAFEYSLFEPKTLSAINLDDGAGNFGRFAMIGFEESVYEFVAADFTIKGATGPSFSGLAASRPEEYDRRNLIIEFQDWNNISGDCTITYTPGTLSSGVTPAPILTHLFTPTGLIPTVVLHPEVIAIHSLDNYQITLEFDMLVTLSDWTTNQDAFTVSALEPESFPVGPGGNIDEHAYTNEGPRLTFPRFWEGFTGGILTDLQEGNDGLFLPARIVELWDGTSLPDTFTSAGDFYSSPAALTTTEVPLEPSTSYIVVGGDRCRTRWENAAGAKIGYSDMPNPGITTPTTVTTPANTAKGHFYYSSAGAKTLSIKVANPPAVAAIGTFTSTPKSLTTKQRIRWAASGGINTNVKIETAVAEITPEIWVEQANGTIITNIPDGDLTGKNLWVRATLSTTDEVSSPILSDLWAEAADTFGTLLKIPLLYPDQMKYPQGEVSVTYNPALGDLIGEAAGSQVLGFTKLFIPENITPWFHPNALEKVEIASVTATPTVTPIIYVGRTTDEKTELASAAITLAALIPVSQLP